MSPFISSGSMLQDFYAKKSSSLHAARKERVRNLRTREEAQAYVDEVKHKIRAAFGPLPERVPLNSRVTGFEEREGIRVEKVIFESHQSIPVTALFFHNPLQHGRRPGVLSVCGHAGEGKACDTYQTYCFNLAAKGFAVLMIDPYSQGERLQFLDRKDAVHISGACVKEHNMMGKGLLLCDEFFGTFRVWDAMCAIDYMVTRPEVDSEKLAVTGNSGGGTLSSYIYALDDRLTMAAPSCFITTFDRNLRNELPVDAEQTPPGMYGSGCEMADFVICRAPNPALIMGQKYDFFDPRGLIEAYEDARHVFTLLDAPERIECFVGPTGHGYSKENREQMYGFFTKQRMGKALPEEQAFNVLGIPECAVTPGGQVMKQSGYKTLVNWIAERAQALEKQRPELDRTALRAKLRGEFDFDRAASPTDYDVLRPGYRVDEMGSQPHFRNMNVYTFESEPGIKGYLHEPFQQGSFAFPEGESCTLCVSHLDAEEEYFSCGVTELPKSDVLFWLDVRGAGKSTPMGCDRPRDYFAPYTFDYFFASNGMLMNESFLGGKVRDVIAAVRLLKHQGFKTIRLAGRGIGSLVATYAAAVLDDRDYSSLCCINGPLSFRSMLDVGVWLWPQSHLYKGLLKDFDLPELYNELGLEKVRLVNPWNHRMQPLTGDELVETIRSTRLNPDLVREMRTR